MVEATDATYERAKAHFSNRVLTEILYVIGAYMFVARIDGTLQRRLKFPAYRLPSHRATGGACHEILPY